MSREIRNPNVEIRNKPVRRGNLVPECKTGLFGIVSGLII